MKHLLLVVFLLFGCGGGSEAVNTEVIEPELVFVKIELPEFTFNDSDYFNGQIDRLNRDSFVFTSHTNNSCTYSQAPKRALESHCRKVNLAYTDELATDRVVKTTIEFVVVAINLLSDMEFSIFWQEWFRRLLLSIDSNGNHPATSLKLKIFDGVLNLCHYDNSWENDWDHGDNSDENNIDIDHSLHPKNTLNGCKVLEVGVSYNVEIINYDSGRFVFIVNDEIISDKEYKSKSETTPSTIMIGHYFNKGFNIENDPLDRVIIRIDNLTMYELTN